MQSSAIRNEEHQRVTREPNEGTFAKVGNASLGIYVKTDSKRTHRHLVPKILCNYQSHARPNKQPKPTLIPHKLLACNVELTPVVPAWSRTVPPFCVAFGPAALLLIDVDLDVVALPFPVATVDPSLT